MGVGLVPATRKFCLAGLTIEQMEVIELNEAFAAQASRCFRPGVADDATHVNPNGGAIALGHPPVRAAPGWSRQRCIS
jgi:acetyl-CoA acetyltransferase